MHYLLVNHLYIPVLLTFGAVTLAFVIWFIFNGGNIDPGEPNARVGA